MLLISNEDVLAAVGIEDCVAAIAEVYREAATGASVFRPRSAIQVPHESTTAFTLASMDGVSRSAGVAAIRIRSDLSTLRDGKKTKYSTSPGNFCGLILLFDIDNAEPVAIFNDGILQQMRVGATSALALGSMARPDSTSLGILGAGGQARSHLSAYLTMLPIEEVRVHSPTSSSREAFANEMSASTGMRVEAVADPEAVFDSDVVAVCTNATRPVFPGKWLHPGVHLSSVRHWAEIGADVMARVDRVVVHQPPRDTWHILTDRDEHTVDAVGEGRGAAVPDDAPTLADLVGGAATGRGSNDEVTYFLNNVGTGIQFAACAGLALRRCRELGLGRHLPTEWFLQQVSD